MRRKNRMQDFEIEDLEVVIGPSGASDAVGGIPCGIVIGVIVTVVVVTG
jgi:hypothetical protein